MRHCSALRLSALAGLLGAGGATGAAAQSIDWTLVGGAATEADGKKLGVIAVWTQPGRCGRASAGA